MDAALLESLGIGRSRPACCSTSLKAPTWLIRPPFLLSLRLPLRDAISVSLGAVA